MTAFAQIDCQIDAQHVHLRLKSVNHRQLKCHVYVGTDSDLESWVTKNLQQTFERGNIEFHLEVRSEHRDEAELKQWIERATSQNLPLPTWADLYAKRGIGILASASIDNPDKLKPHISSCIELMRQRRLEEGSDMITHMLRDTSILNDLLKNINRQLPRHQQARIEKFKHKLNEYLEAIDGETREDLTRECAHLLERIDVQEECDRLQTHLLRLQNSLEQEHRGGRYLDFLCQEIHREITTLGNKCQSAEVSESVVSFKTHLEKLREQCQNLE
jgi:uncharacterized protein YicC (UPF0701 family)